MLGWELSERTFEVRTPTATAFGGDGEGLDGGVVVVGVDGDLVGAEAQLVGVEDRAAVGEVELPAVPRAAQDLVLAAELEVLLVGRGQEALDLAQAERAGL